MAGMGGPGGGPGGKGAGAPRPKNAGKIAKRTLSYLSRFKGRMIIAVVFVALYVLGNVGGSYLISPLVSGLLSTGDSYSMLWMTFDTKTEFLVGSLILLGSIYALAILSNFIYNRIFIRVSTRTLYNIRTDLFGHMQTLPIRYFDTYTHGDLMSRYTSDIDTMNEFIARGIPQVVASSLQAIAVITLMLILSWQLTICAFVMLVCMTLAAKFFGAKAKVNYAAQQKAVGKVNGYVEELVEGQRVVKVFNHEKQVIGEFDEINQEWRRASTRANSYASMMMPVMGNITNIFYAVIAVVGALLTMRLDDVNAKAIMLGNIAAFLVLLKQFANPIQQLSMQVNSIFMALAGAERVFGVIDTPSEVDEGYVTLVNANIDSEGSITESDKRTGTWAWKHPHSDGTVSYTKLCGDVVFEDVTFGYNKDKVVLNNISLYAEPGQKIAFVGSTGAGKTTITNLINRFYDIEDGKIRYDGININKISKKDLRRSLGMVLQDTHLFTGTVMDNIRYGNLDATDDMCIQAAKTANAHFFISHLPQGYDTELSGDGANLSQGQRQLIAIARAAVADPPVLILDEATSSIDTRTEWLIEKGMDALMEGRTTFVIAHRLSTVRNSNAIMVLENGNIIERGNHDELISQEGKYYQLYTGAFELS